MQVDYASTAMCYSMVARLQSFALLAAPGYNQRAHRHPYAMLVDLALAIKCHSQPNSHGSEADCEDDEASSCARLLHKEKKYACLARYIEHLSVYDLADLSPSYFLRKVKPEDGAAAYLFVQQYRHLFADEEGPLFDGASKPKASGHSHMYGTGPPGCVLLIRAFYGCNLTEEEREYLQESMKDPEPFSVRNVLSTIQTCHGRDFHTVRTLCLKANYLSDDDVPTLEALMERLPNCQHLSVDGNTRLGSSVEARQAFRRLLRRPGCLSLRIEGADGFLEKTGDDGLTFMQELVREDAWEELGRLTWLHPRAVCDPSHWARMVGEDAFTIKVVQAAHDKDN